MFSIGTISLFETIQYVKTTNVEIMDIDVKTIISKPKIWNIKHKEEDSWQQIWIRSSSGGQGVSENVL